MDGTQRRKSRREDLKRVIRDAKKHFEALPQREQDQLRELLKPIGSDHDYLYTDSQCSCRHFRDN